MVRFSSDAHLDASTSKQGVHLRSALRKRLTLAQTQFCFYYWGSLLGKRELATLAGRAPELCVRVLSSSCPALVLWPCWSSSCPSLVLLLSSSCLLSPLAALANPVSFSGPPSVRLLLLVATFANLLLSSCHGGKPRVLLLSFVQVCRQSCLSLWAPFFIIALSGPCPLLGHAVFPTSTAVFMRL